MICPNDLMIMCYISRETNKGEAVDIVKIKEHFKDSMDSKLIEKLVSNMRDAYLECLNVCTEDSGSTYYFICEEAKEFVDWANDKFFNEEL